VRIDTTEPKVVRRYGRAPTRRRREALSLDDTVEPWLPGLVPNGENITVLWLLAHKSGLFDCTLDPRVLKPYLSGNLSYCWAPRRLVQIAVSHKPLFAFGTAVSYSATGMSCSG
jgi:D-alanyl-D-alanine carboxypeptidase